VVDCWVDSERHSQWTILCNFLTLQLQVSRAIYMCRYGSTIPPRLVVMRAAWRSTASPSCSRRWTASRRRWPVTWTAFTTLTIPAPSSYSPARLCTSWCRPPATRPRPGRHQDGGGSAWSRLGRGTTSGTTSATSSNRSFSSSSSLSEIPDFWLGWPLRWQWL